MPEFNINYLSLDFPCHYSCIEWSRSPTWAEACGSDGKIHVHVVHISAPIHETKLTPLPLMMSHPVINQVVLGGQVSSNLAAPLSHQLNYQEKHPHLGRLHPFGLEFCIYIPIHDSELCLGPQ